MPEPPRPIPAFYCCYLLRSKNRKSYYIGSTPNPARRLAQHNGKSKGGAKRTSVEGKRPWEMTCIVYGFPSKPAALQFEWAWQNTHATRHIERDVRDARLDEMQKAKKGSPSKRKSRPPMSLEARLKNLRYLLSVKSFKRWPLQIRFFATDVFELWERQSAKLGPALRKDVSIQLTPAQLPNTAVGDQTPQIPEIIRTIPVAYEDSKPHVEKGKTLLEDPRTYVCTVCRKTADASTSLVLVCTLEACRAISHLQCLSSKFLREEGARDALVPLEGTCPGCYSPLKWATLIKELSLRTRGQKEIEAMFKPKRRRKEGIPTDHEPADPETLDVEDEELEDTWIHEIEDDEDDPLSLDSIIKS